MKLFHEKGYDATSMADIAKEMYVVPGLCYRYFNSKQEIFDVAVKQYAKESCQDILLVIHDHEKPFKERLGILETLMIHKEDNSRYHDFYHTPGNETFHLQLSIEMFKYISPHISKGLSELTKKGELSVDNPEAITDFILCGQASLWLPPLNDSHSIPFQERLEQIRKYMYKLLEIQE